MIVIRKINNNVAFCLDSNNNELIAFGKGIGFPSLPYEISDLDKIDRTYYGVNASYFELINEIPEEIFEVTARIVDIARNYIDCELNRNVVFALADHINFAIERKKKNIRLRAPFVHEIQYFYENEMEMGEIALKLIQRELGIELPDHEAGNIAMHFINAELESKNEEERNLNDSTIIEITELVERELAIKIKKKDFNYLRFVSHLQYLLKRKNSGTIISSDNRKMFDNMVHEFPKIYECTLEIKKYIENTLHWEPNQEELLYLILHLNRLYARVDCNR